MMQILKNKAKTEDGFVLNITVWISILLLMSALLTSTSARTNNFTLRNNLDLLKSQEIAMGGFEVASSILGDKGFLDSLLHQQTTVALKISNADVIIKFEDERGKIDLNTFPPNILRKMFVSVGARHGIDAFTAVEIADRLSALPTSESSNHQEKIRSIADLQFVNGITLDFYKALEPLITVHGLDRKINPLTAHYDVLTSLPDVKNADLQKLFAARTNGTPRPSLGVAEPWLTTLSGPVYKIIVTVVLPNKISHTLTALVLVSERELGVTDDAIKVIEIH